MKKIFVIAFVLIVSQNLKAQEKFEWNAKYFSFLDNREYDKEFAMPQTIFGSRIDLSAGFRIDSVHLIQIGANYLYEFGAKANAIPLYPTLYYSFSNKNYDFSIGAFPRKELLKYPKLLLNDTLAYYRPNVEGTLLNYKGHLGHQNLWIDWVGRQTDKDDERFLAGTSGELKKNYLFIENYLYMYHHAANAKPDTSFHLRDNGGGLLLLGADFTEKYYFRIAIGSAFSYDRHRPKPYIISKGFFAKLKLEYKRITLNISHYQGDAITLGYGDALYKTGKYTRIDADYNFIKNKRINLLLQFSGHFYKDNFNSNQKLTLQFMLN